jgi:hypothetical protein
MGQQKLLIFFTLEQDLFFGRGAVCEVFAIILDVFACCALNEGFVRCGAASFVAFAAFAAFAAVGMVLVFFLPIKSIQAFNRRKYNLHNISYKYYNQFFCY